MSYFDPPEENEGRETFKSEYFDFHSCVEGDIINFDHDYQLATLDSSQYELAADTLEEYKHYLVDLYSLEGCPVEAQISFEAELQSEKEYWIERQAEQRKEDKLLGE